MLNRRKMHAEHGRQFFLAVLVAIRTDAAHLFRGVLARARLTSKFQAFLVVGAMTNGVLVVSFGGIPTQVGKSAIVPYSVLMATFHTFRAWANESLKHQAMKNSWKCLSIAAQIYQRITVGSGAGVKYARCAFESGMRRKATLYTTKVANAIPVKAGNRSPLFGFKFFDGKFRTSHACHAPNMMCVVRPVRLLAQSFGSFCILAQNA